MAIDYATQNYFEAAIHTIEFVDALNLDEPQCAW